MKKPTEPTQRKQVEKDLSEFEAAATRLETRLNKLGVTEKDLLAAAATVRERMLAEVYALSVEEPVQP